MSVAILVGLASCSSDGAPAADSNTVGSDAVTTNSTSPDTSSVPGTAAPDTAAPDTAAAGPTTTADGAAQPDLPESVQLTDEPGTTFESLDASPDGSTIAFENEHGVGLLSVESGDISYVVENDDTTTATKPTYLGDGRLALLIAEPGEVGGTINIIDDAGAPQPLDLPVTVVDIEGATDDTIVYVSLTDEARGIGSVQADAASPAPQTITGGLNDHDPTVTPGGTQLAFIRTDTDDAGNEVNTLITTDIAGGVEVPIIASPRNGVLRAPSWSPDGGRLIVTMTATGSDGVDVEQLFVIDPALGEIQATDGEGDKPEAVWISDGEIAYRIVTDDQRNGQIFRVAAPAAG